MRDKKTPTLLKIKNSLGPLEEKVMQVMWDKDEVGVSDVTKVIKNERPVAYTTIMTIMDTLFKKEFLTRHKVGKAYQYKTVAPRAVFLKNALSSVMIDLIETYGREQVLLATLRFNTSLVRQLKTSTISVAKISQYKTPVGYGMIFTLLATVLLYSAWDLFQNLQFFGTTQYIALALSEPTLIFQHLNLVTLAIVESLPIVNISATAVFFVLFVLVGKKMNKITDRNIFPRLGGLA